MSCTQHLSTVQMPRQAGVEEAVRNATKFADTQAGRELAARRKVWDLMPLGYDLDVLWLHIKTLAGVVGLGPFPVDGS